MTRRPASCSGGNKSLLFNAEYLINVAGPVRLVLFYDAGQVRDRGQNFAWKEDLTAQQYPPQLTGVPLLYDPFAVGSLQNPLDVVPQLETRRHGTGQCVQDLDRRRDPVLHAGPERAVPADLRDEPVARGVLDSNLRPEKQWKFRFAVGSTF